MRQYSVTGTLTEGRIVTLDEPLPVSAAKVRLIVECVEPKPIMAPEEFEKMLRERQEARGHVPRSHEEVAAYLQAERDSWDR